jgi:predicted lipoprotein with Yx(FWY)xxD motif
MRLMFGIAFALLLAGPAIAGGIKGPPASVQSAAPGAILTDASGMTLYTSDADGRYRPGCDGECALTWRPFPVDPGLCGDSDWAIVSRSDGMSQWAYSGRPLYTFAGDKKPGDQNGAGAEDGVWHVAKLLCFASAASGEPHGAEAIVDAAVEAGVEPIRELRDQCGLSLGELATMSRIARADLDAHETGRRSLTMPEVAAVANALGVPIYLLLE